MTGSDSAPRFAGRYPYQSPIDAYGNGGFRFAGMSHRGSILCLPSGIHAWEVAAPAELSVAHIAPVLAERSKVEFILLGTGRTLVFPSAEIRAAFTAADMGLEAMDTGAAIRTYNILLGEGRPVGAALIAVT
jgi:uncharacterized protein